MFNKKKESPAIAITRPQERVNSVLGKEINWKGDLRGKGGIRIEGSLEGEIVIRGLVVIGESGRVTCDVLKAESVIVAGQVKGNIISQKLEIRSTGRVWGDVVTVSFTTEEGAFLRGQITMEDSIDLDIGDATIDSDVAEDNPSGSATTEGEG